MATIPYQPTYTVQPKYGFRYGPSAFAPTISTVAPPPVGLQGSQATPPPVMGTQQGSPTPAYYQDPLAQGGGREGGQPDYRPVAQQLGYTPGQQHPMNVLNMLPGGTIVTGALGINDDPKYNYGKYGTYDYSGNVFGTEGRAYNPITGKAAQSSASPQAWMGNWLGIGTEEGFGGPSSSYGKLRGSGENVFNSLFGSYENSIYAQRELNPSLNTAQARAAMARGTADARGVPTVQGLIEANTKLADPMYGVAMTKDGPVDRFAEDDIDRLEGSEITKEMLGFDDSRPDPGPISGKFGTAVGDIARTPSGKLGVIQANGTIATPTGTTVSITDPYTGQTISLLGSTSNSATGQNTISAQTELARNQALDTLNDPEGGGMSGFSVSDGQGGSYETSSSGNTEARADGTFGGIMGMEDEYDEPDRGSDSGGGKGTHCCTAAEKRGDMSLTEVKKLRAWHRKQSIVWQKGYDIWGKVIADHLVAKFKWQSDRVRDFYNHKIYGKRTLGSVYADVVIYPMSIVIGCGVLLSSFIIREKNNEAKKSF